MVGALLNALVFAGVLGCQRRERREAQGDVATSLPIRPVPVITADSQVQTAQLQLADGHPAVASSIVMPLLRIAERRTPEAILVAARAASEWGGWHLVTAMLTYEPWLDSRFAGEGHELLARAALERGDATAAREHAAAALRVANDPASRGLRMVLLARALDRLEQRDSAVAMYKQAADALPLVREWLLLRAAGSTPDPKSRQRMYSRISGAAAKTRVAYTEAQALERFRMPLASADAYEKLGDIPSAYRLRLVASDAAVRSGLRSGLLGYLQRDARGDDLQRAIEVLDAAFPALDPTTELLVARRAAEGGVSARAASGYASVPAALLTDADQIAWSRALIAIGKPTEAATRIARRKFSVASAAEAQYVRGLALVRAGKSTAARSALQRVITTSATAPQAADALYLIADMESDARRDTRARDLFQRSCLHVPAGGYSDESCFRAGILNFVLGDARRAATMFEELPKSFPSSPEVTAATYWSGRAWERAGNTALAREKWANVVTVQPLSYYAAVSSKRLGTTRWMPAEAQIPTAPEFQTAVARASALDALGMDTEEKYEYEGMEAEATTPALALGAGKAMLERGEITRAIRLGWRAIGTRGAEASDSAFRGDERGYSLVYPVLEGPQLIARAKENKLDPALVAAVIRQESSWNPRAVSRAGARGLMQLMPPVGQEIARSKRYAMWDPGLLFDPDVSLELGTSHLHAALGQYSSLPRALAAYNAGASRVQRWMRMAGTKDPELFIERIPFVETRDYVRIVMRNAELYRALHGLSK